MQVIFVFSITLFEIISMEKFPCIKPTLVDFWIIFIVNF